MTGDKKNPRHFTKILSNIQSGSKQDKVRSKMDIYPEEWSDTQVENDSHCHLLGEYMDDTTHANV